MHYIPFSPLTFCVSNNKLKKAIIIHLIDIVLHIANQNPKAYEFNWFIIGTLKCLDWHIIINTLLYHFLNYYSIKENTIAT